MRLIRVGPSCIHLQGLSIPFRFIRRSGSFPLCSDHGLHSIIMARCAFFLWTAPFVVDRAFNHMSLPNTSSAEGFVTYGTVDTGQRLCEGEESVG